MRIWYGVHPDELSEPYVLRLYLDVCSRLRAQTDRRQCFPDIYWLHHLLLKHTMPKKRMIVNASYVDVSDYHVKPQDIELGVHIWPIPLSCVSIQSRIRDIQDWQAICRREHYSPELMHSIRTYGVWPGGSAAVYEPSSVKTISDADIAKYVRFCRAREERECQKKK